MLGRVSRKRPTFWSSISVCFYLCFSPEVKTWVKEVREREGWQLPSWFCKKAVPTGNSLGPTPQKPEKKIVFTVRSVATKLLCVLYSKLRSVVPAMLPGQRRARLDAPDCSDTTVWQWMDSRLLLCWTAAVSCLWLSAIWYQLALWNTRGKRTCVHGDERLYPIADVTAVNHKQIRLLMINSKLWRWERAYQWMQCLVGTYQSLWISFLKLGKVKMFASVLFY